MKIFLNLIFIAMENPFQMILREILELLEQRLRVRQLGLRKA